MSESNTPAPDITFRNVTEVASYLKRRGFKVSKSSVYNHAKEKRFRRNSDGVFARAEIDRYAQGLDRLDGFKPGEDRAEEARLTLLESKAQKSKAEAELAEIKLRLEQGKLVPVEEVEKLMIGAASVLRASMMQFIYSEAKALVHLVGGKPDKTPDLVDRMREAASGWLHGFSKHKDFLVDFGGTDDDQGFQL